MAIIKIMVLLDVMSCNLVARYQCFGGTGSLGLINNVFWGEMLSSLVD